jgi:hypothetical protein
VKRTLHLLAVVVTFALTAQAFAAARGDLLVCRFTGKVVGGCPCPGGGKEPAKIAATSCCEVRAAPRLPPSRTELTRQPEVQVTGFAAAALAPAPFAAGSGDRAERISPETSPPPRERIFIQLRQLLI